VIAQHNVFAVHSTNIILSNGAILLPEIFILRTLIIAYHITHHLCILPFTCNCILMFLNSTVLTQFAVFTSYLFTNNKPFSTNKLFCPLHLFRPFNNMYVAAFCLHRDHLPSLRSFVIPLSFEISVLNHANPLLISYRANFLCIHNAHKFRIIIKYSLFCSYICKQILSFRIFASSFIYLYCFHILFALFSFGSYQTYLNPKS
jgi:hypothetical protein